MIEKMREDFKEWARSRGLSLPVNDDIHYNEWTQLAWDSWQASRADIEIELPGHDCDPGWNAAVRDCRSAIEAVGLKVKP